MMLVLWLSVACLAVFSCGAWLGYMAGHDDGRRERAREEWKRQRP